MLIIAAPLSFCCTRPPTNAIPYWQGNPPTKRHRVADLTTNPCSPVPSQLAVSNFSPLSPFFLISVFLKQSFARSNHSSLLGFFYCFGDSLCDQSALFRAYSWFFTVQLVTPFQKKVLHSLGAAVLKRSEPDPITPLAKYTTIVLHHFLGAPLDHISGTSSSY